MKEKDKKKLFRKVFGIHLKIGDKIRFKYGKVDWEVYAKGEYLATDGNLSHYYKLKRKRRGIWGDTIYTEVWDWETRFQEIELTSKDVE